MNAQKLLEFLLELKADGVDLSKVSVNYRYDSDSDVEVVKYVGEDLFDPRTNSILESIVLQSEKPWI
jgi:hypothetical protein